MDSPAAVGLVTGKRKLPPEDSEAKRKSTAPSAIGSSNSNGSAVGKVLVTTVANNIQEFRVALEASKKREQALLARLKYTEDEVQTLLRELQGYRQSEKSTLENLEKTLFDPAANLLLEHLRATLKEKDSIIEEKIRELQVVKFSTDNQIGKRLMSKLEALLEENKQLADEKRVNIEIQKVKNLEKELEYCRSKLAQYYQDLSKNDMMVLQLDYDSEQLQNKLFRKEAEIHSLKMQLVEKDTQIAKLKTSVSVPNTDTAITISNTTTDTSTANATTSAIASAPAPPTTIPTTATETTTPLRTAASTSNIDKDDNGVANMEIFPIASTSNSEVQKS